MLCSNDWWLNSVRLNVWIFSRSDAPEKVTLSMSPSGDIAKGSSMTFSCSSDASPPVRQTGYSLYKDENLIRSGQSHTISDVQPGHSGMYYCQAWNNISRRGNDLMKSAEVHLDVHCKYVDMSHCYRTQAHCLDAWVSRFSCCVHEGSESWSCNNGETLYTWFDERLL